MYRLLLLLLPSSNLAKKGEGEGDALAGWRMKKRPATTTAAATTTCLLLLVVASPV